MQVPIAYNKERTVKKSVETSHSVDSGTQSLPQRTNLGEVKREYNWQVQNGHDRNIRQMKERGKKGGKKERKKERGKKERKKEGRKEGRKKKKEGRLNTYTDLRS